MDARRVDDDELATVLLEPDIDGVARRPRHLRDDPALLLRARVDERRLADVATSDDRDLHDRRLGRVAGGPQVLGDVIEKVLASPQLFRADRDRIAEPEGLELVHVRLVLLRVDLVDNNDERDLLRSRPQPLRDDPVERRDALANVGDEQDEIRPAQREVDLLLDVVAEVIAVDDADTAGVDDLHQHVLVLDES